jgi:hypothetical protein
MTARGSFFENIAAKCHLGGVLRDVSGIPDSRAAALLVFRPGLR